MAGMKDDPGRRRRPAPVGTRRSAPRVAPDPDPTTGAPAATVPHHEHWVEREPWAKYTGALAGLRIAAALALRAKRRARGEYVPPQPWFPALVTTGLLAVAIGVVWAIAQIVGAL